MKKSPEKFYTGMSHNVLDDNGKTRMPCPDDVDDSNMVEASTPFSAAMETLFSEARNCPWPVAARVWVLPCDRSLPIREYEFDFKANRIG